MQKAKKGKVESKYHWSELAIRGCEHASDRDGNGHDHRNTLPRHDCGRDLRGYDCAAAE